MSKADVIALTSATAFVIGMITGGVMGAYEGKTDIITAYCTTDRTVTLEQRDECIEKMRSLTRDK